MKTPLRLTIAVVVLAAFELSATTLYVSLESTNPIAPFATWATAATNIQDAVDAAQMGDTVLVTNGLYATGARAVGTDTLVNRVAVDKPLTLRSVNGPQFTAIQGYQVPGITNGDGAIRCVYLATGAGLSGFTLTNGATLISLGNRDWWEDPDGQGGGLWCASTNAIVTNCVLTGNAANVLGAGAYRGTLYNCILTGNSSHYHAGGAFESVLHGCVLTGNSAPFHGGGVYGGTLYNCTLTGNLAQSGGGAAGIVFEGADVMPCTLYHCILTTNSSSFDGGGADGCTLYNCTLTGNSANYGGGAADSRLYNSTLTGNRAGYGGGTYRGTLQNCIVYYNTAIDGSNYHGSTSEYSCTTPQPPGAGNVVAEPGFRSADRGDLRLDPASPCIDAGRNLTNLIITDLDGNRRPLDGDGDGVAAFDIGAYEFDPRPTVTEEPLSQTAYVGITVTFNVGALGLVPLHYQWRHNGTMIAGATNSTLILNTLTTNQAGGYDVVITNAAGSVTSQVAVLTVVDAAPLITTQPASQAVYSGGNVTLNVVAEGSLPLFYQWQFDGTRIPDATNSCLALRAVATNQAGAHSVIVSNALGTITSAVATVIVYPPGTRYVWQNSPSPVAPYTSWATAATSIQDAVDVAAAGDEVVVTNGVYASGGRAVGTNLLFNRVAVDRPMTLRSVNGAESTIIKGAHDGAGWSGVGDRAVRCVYLADGASLSGFTLTNGATRSAGDWPTWQESSGGGVWCESTNAALTDCVLVGNLAVLGGGASRGTLDHCTLTGNSAGYGGGVYESLLGNCTLRNNHSWGGWEESAGGGGAYGSTLYSCALTGNSSAFASGGAKDSTLHNCLLTGNSAAWGGGGAGGSTLNNCALTGNRAEWGGGAAGGTLSNCTLTGNSAAQGGGVAGSALNNCIVYFNTATDGANHWESTLEYCCSAPLPTNGVGNIDANPRLATASHLSATSPCVGAGSSAYASGMDIDGEPWADPPCMGADQLIPGDATGPLSLWIQPNFTHVPTNYTVSFKAENVGPILGSVWSFGDGTGQTNQPFVTHTWSTPGFYTVQLTGYNDTLLSGTGTTIVVQVSTGIRYVNPANTNPARPYETWDTAAISIQEAIGSGLEAGGLVLVTNGVYRVGAVIINGTNRVALTNTVLVQSVNGPQVTVIEGETNGVRCAYVGNGSVLSGFTLTNGTAVGDELSGSGGGGGVWCESTAAIVTNCVIVGNHAQYGGGASGGRFHDCILSANSASGDYRAGGGAYASILHNCTVLSNTAPAYFGNGGGVSESTLYYCRLIANSATNSGGGACGSTLNNCTLTGNSAGYAGGGAWLGTLNNCMLAGNAAHVGGGAEVSTLNNCTVVGNSAQYGGGVYGGWLTNCVVFFNRATYGPNYHIDPGIPFSRSMFSTSCTAPPPTDGAGNIGTDPRFVNAAAGDFRLLPDSPCIDAGTNLTELISNDIARLPRPLDGNGDGIAAFDMGAYEFNPYRFESPPQLTADGLVFTIWGERGKTVRLERSTDLVHWETVARVSFPASGRTLIDPAATTEPVLFYRAVSAP